MDYRNLSVENLASNESFIDWVNKSDPEAVRHWDLYISNHPEIKPTVDKARALILNLKAAEETGQDSEQINSIWSGIRSRVQAEEKVSEVPSSKSRWLVALAAALLLCAASVFWLFYPTGSKPESGYYQQKLSEFIEKVNESDQPMTVTLDDGTVVMLEGKSRLKYRHTFSRDSSRQVYLLGKAYFDVMKNPYKPFIVHSNEIDVKVLGTSFRVESPEHGDKILVSVKTGKVSVVAVSQGEQDRQKPGGIVLLPNQQVTYARKERLFQKSLVESPELLKTNTISPGDFVFDNTPITDVFRIIESAYGVEIIFNEEVMKNCYLTAPLGNESLHDKLKIICATIGATYEIIDANIVVTSPGCP